MLFGALSARFLHRNLGHDPLPPIDYRIQIDKSFCFCMLFLVLSQSYLTENVPYSKADPASARRARAPLFEFFGGPCFGKHVTRIYFNCSHHTMITICTLFSTLTTKHRVCVKGASKQSSSPQNSSAPGLRPGFTIPG